MTRSYPPDAIAVGCPNSPPHQGAVVVTAVVVGHGSGNAQPGPKSPSAPSTAATAAPGPTPSAPTPHSTAERTTTEATAAEPSATEATAAKPTSAKATAAGGCLIRQREGHQNHAGNEDCNSTHEPTSMISWGSIGELRGIRRQLAHSGKILIYGGGTAGGAADYH